MQEYSLEDYKSILTAVIQKQIAILGPQITLTKVKNVPGLAIDNNGTVTAITKEPQQVMKALIEQFVQLSGLIVEKTLEPLYLQHLDGTKETIQPSKTDIVAPSQITTPTLTQPPIAPSMNHLDTSQVVNAQSGETQQAVDMQHIIDEAAKGVHV